MKKPNSIVTFIFFIILKNIAAVQYDLWLNSENKNWNHAELTIDVMNNCFDKNHTILISSDNNEMLLSTSQLTSLSTLILINNLSTPESSFPTMVYHQSPKLFVISSTLKNLKSQLKNLQKNSCLWNIEEPLIMTNGNFENSNCSAAKDFLFTAWKMDLINAIYVCIDNDKDAKLFAYNPYTNQAPKSWKISKIVAGLYDHPWTLLEQPYGLIKYKKRNGSTFAKEQIEVCHSLIFDRTHDLGKYPVKVNMNEDPPFLHLHDVNGNLTLSEIDYEINYLSLTRINATIVPFIFEAHKKTGKLFGQSMSVSLGLHDVCLNSKGMTNIPNTKFSQAFIPVSIKCLTKKYYDSNAKDFVKIAPILIYVLFFIIGLVIFGFLQYKLKNCMKNINIMMVIQIILSLPLERSPKKFALRIIIFGIVILFVIINIFVPGELQASFSTNKESKNVEELSDLNAKNYRVVARSTLLNYFDFSDINNIRSLKFNETCENVVIDRNDACLNYNVVLQAIPDYEKMYHIPKETIIFMVKSYLFRRDWPPFARITHFHSRLMSSGITTHWSRKINQDMIAKNLMNATSWNPLKFQNFKLAFGVLISGSILSIIVFIGEYVIWKLKNKKVK